MTWSWVGQRRQYPPRLFRRYYCFPPKASFFSTPHSFKSKFTRTRGIWDPNILSTGKLFSTNTSVGLYAIERCNLHSKMNFGFKLRCIRVLEFQEFDGF